jgi:dCMP deaminase
MKTTKWQQAYIDTAERFSALSTAQRLQVGAIVVKDDRIISIGYNGMPSGWSNVCEDENGKTKPQVLHAEENCIVKLAQSNESGEDAEMYITHAPCINCARLIYGSGISRVFYRNDYRSKDGIDFLIKSGVEVSKI